MLFQWAAVTFSIHTPFKVLFFVKNIGQWNAKSGPKAAYGNFAMRKKNSGSLKKKWKRKGINGSHFAHTHTHSAKLVVRMIWWHHPTLLTGGCHMYLSPLTNVQQCDDFERDFCTLEVGLQNVVPISNPLGPTKLITADQNKFPWTLYGSLVCLQIFFLSSKLLLALS